MKYFKFFIFLILASSLQAKPHSRDELKPVGSYVQDELILGIPNQAHVNQMNWAELGLKLMKKLGSLPFYRVKIVDQSTPAAKKESLERSREKLGVTTIEFNYYYQPYAIYTPQTYPNDPYYQNGDGKFDIVFTQADLAWKETIGGMNVWSQGGPISAPVAIIDSGVLASHEDLQGRMLTGWNVLLGNTNTTDNYYHGTGVAGTCGASNNNGKGIAGFLGNGMMIPVKISDNGTYLGSDMIAGINWAALNGAKVLNLSVGGFPLAALQAACDDAFYNKGCVIFGASGNTGTNVSNYPASYDSVIGMGASQHQDKYAAYSTYNNQLDLVATSGSMTPGVYITILGITTSSDYTGGAGTSTSTGVGSALASILMSNGVIWYECVSRMARTSDKIDSVSYPYSIVAGHPLGTWNDHLGYGRINFYRAMKTLVAPVLNSATPSLIQVDLSYSAPPLSDAGISGYNIYRSTGPGGPYTKINGSLVAGTTYTDSAVASGQTWYYVVKGVDNNPEAFETKPSNELSAYVPFPTPTFTSTFTASPTFTVTPTLTMTPTITQSFTASPTFTVSPTITPTLPVPTPVPGSAGYVYPQPATGDSVTLVYSLGQAGTVKSFVYNQSGHLVARQSENGQARADNQMKLDIKGWGWGIYYLILETDDGRRTPLKFVVGK